MSRLSIANFRLPIGVLSSFGRLSRELLTTDY